MKKIIILTLIAVAAFLGFWLDGKYIRWQAVDETVFEGATAYAHKVEVSKDDPTADRSLPDRIDDLGNRYERIIKDKDAEIEHAQKFQHKLAGMIYSLIEQSGKKEAVVTDKMPERGMITFSEPEPKDGKVTLKISLNGCLPGDKPVFLDGVPEKQ